MTTSGRSGHVDTFCRDNLPARELWPEFRFDRPDLQYAPRLNAAVELLDATAARFGGDRPCLLAPDGTRWSYAEVAARVNRIAHVLVDDLGIVAGNRVLLRAPNTPTLAACWLAVLKAGGVVVASVPLLRPLEIATLVEITQPQLALCDPRFLEDLAVGAPGLRTVTMGGPDAELDALTAGKPDAFDAVATAADDVAILATTSGTTGRPK